MPSYYRPQPDANLDIQGECILCYTEYGLHNGSCREVAVALKCGHVFGHDCLYRAIAVDRLGRCPLCRRECLPWLVDSHRNLNDISFGEPFRVDFASVLRSRTNLPQLQLLPASAHAEFLSRRLDHLDNRIARVVRLQDRWLRLREQIRESQLAANEMIFGSIVAQVVSGRAQENRVQAVRFPTRAHREAFVAGLTTIRQQDNAASGNFPGDTPSNTPGETPGNTSAEESDDSSHDCGCGID